MKELSDQALEGVIGGASVPVFEAALYDPGKSKLCGKYFARDGKEAEAPDCSLCIHSSRNAWGVYGCTLE